MKIQYASDLHLEFRENRLYLNEKPLKPIGDVLLLAGDIVPFGLLDEHADFFAFISDNFEASYWVPGNHEYYHFDLADKSGSLHEKIKTNVWLVNNVAIQRADVRLVFSTLWTQISMANQWKIQRAMSDFQAITYRGKAFTPYEYNRQYKLGLEFLMTELPTKAQKTIVVTHHVPTFLNYPEKYRGDLLNEAFAVELFDLIESSGVHYWIYGHHHQTVPTFKIGSTSMVNNQLGYVQNNEHRMFDLAAVIDI
jgi:predicted phosphohydrolase